MFRKSILNARMGLSLSVLSMLALSACAKPPQTVPVIFPPSSLIPCEEADPSQVKTVADITAFAIEQTAHLRACEAKRAAAVGGR